MQYFNIADERADSCDVCCCQSARGKPGQTDKWVLNYAPVIVPANALSLQQGTCFEIENVSCCSDIDDPTTPATFSVLPGEVLEGDLRDFVSIDDGVPASYSLAPFSRPKHGRLTLGENGEFLYEPIGAGQGCDRFFWQVRINGGTPMVQEAVIQVGNSSRPDACSLTPPICINNPVIDNRRFTLSFGVSVSPAARKGDLYRLTVKQRYRDCDNCFVKHDCFDIHIGDCF